MSLWGQFLFSYHKCLTELRENNQTSMLLPPDVRKHCRRGCQKIVGLAWSRWQGLQGGDQEEENPVWDRSGGQFQDPLPGTHFFQQYSTTSPNGATSWRPGAKHVRLWQFHIPTTHSWRHINSLYCCVDNVTIEFTVTYYWLGTKVRALSLASVNFKENKW